MAQSNCNIILVILLIIAIIFIIYYVNKNNNKPIPNEGSLPDDMFDSSNQNHGHIDNLISQYESTDSGVSDKSDGSEFIHRGKKYRKRSQKEEIDDLFDIEKMMPQEFESDWFDIEPLQTTKKIKGSNLIHPKVHMGESSGTLKNPTHDIRGDIPNPKIKVSPWGNSTIDPDEYGNGLCR